MSERGYFLAIRGLGAHHELKIDQAQFDELMIAKTNLEHFHGFEEQWACVVQNYLDLEKGLLEAAARHMIIVDHDWQTYQELQLNFAIRLANLLSSCRAYIDQSKRHLGALIPLDDSVGIFEDALSEQYDARFGFRFMEALRNYAQHRGLPLHGSSYGIRHQRQDGLAYYVETNIEIDKLKGDSSFKQSILPEVTDENFPSEPLVREYIAGLSVTHIKVRELLASKVACWMHLVRDAVSQYSSSTEEQAIPMALYAIERDENDEWLRFAHIGDNLLQSIELLQKRHGSLERVPECFVSGAIRPKR